MPSPLELLLDPVSLTVFAIYAGADRYGRRCSPARRCRACVAGELRALLAFVVYFFLSSYLPLLWARVARRASSSST